MEMAIALTRSVKFVLIFNSYNLEELETAIRCQCPSASCRHTCSYQISLRLHRAARHLRVCSLTTCAQSLKRELQMVKETLQAMILQLQPAKEVGEREAAASCVTAGVREAQAWGRTAWEEEGERPRQHPRPLSPPLHDPGAWINYRHRAWIWRGMICWISFRMPARGTFPKSFIGESCTELENLLVSVPIRQKLGLNSARKMSLFLYHLACCCN